tara:strand:+ start:21654 stop:23525 length:1872 start_codon:yes stop_codon:yes gene_type:complete
MCGITGIFDFRKPITNNSLINSMTNEIIHRGPDAGETYISNNIALGHRRLSIIDISSEANQPMFSDNDEIVIVYNGEVYNFSEIKEDLLTKGFSFSTTSDTEVVLKAYQEYGVKAFKMFNGMFALAIYDSRINKLFLARDRFGIKPLYYYYENNVFLFASEKKSILKYHNKKLSLDYQAFSEYMWFGNPLGNNTFYKDIKEFQPGSFGTISEDGFFNEKYFDINSIEESTDTEDEVVNNIRILLEESVKSQLVSDVPVGIFLSGGIDSSAITAFASKHYNGKIKTYSVGFDYDKGVNELPLAKEISELYNTEHYEVKIDEGDIIEVIEELVKSHDEPFADAANIPLYLMTKKIKGKVKVVLQGDGGDEFFGGYSRYNTLHSINKWNWLSVFLPIMSFFRFANPKIYRIQRFINAISKKQDYLRNALLLTMDSEYTKPYSVLTHNIRKKISSFEPFKKYKDIYNSYSSEKDLIQKLFFTDAQIILKDTFLEKVDKSVMANSIEVRVPFIDNKLTEYMLSIPGKLKTKNAVPKYLLKKALEGIVPNKILYGKKKGFGVPYGFWLKTKLENYFIEQISTDRVSKFFNINEIKRLFKLHKKDKGYYGFLLWKVLIFAVWVNINEIDE